MYSRTAIKDLKIGTKYQGVYICKTHSVKVTKTNTPYLDMILLDKTGEINAKWWSIDPGFNVENIEDGNFIIASFSVEDYMGAPQVKIDRMKIPGPTDMFDKSEIVPTAPIPAEKMYDELISAINDMENGDIQRLCYTIISDNKKALMTAPGAKSMHHAVVSGLLLHVTGMLKLAETIAELYAPLVNRDLLVGGVILHDICKLREYVLGPVGLCTDYSKEGKLLGHLAMGASYVEEMGKTLKINPEVTTMMMHMLLSHHGEPEFGAAVRPQFLEAVLLAKIDDIDAKIYMVNEVMQSVAPGEFSPKIYGMGNISMYKPNI